MFLKTNNVLDLTIVTTILILYKMYLKTLICKKKSNDFQKKSSNISVELKSEALSNYPLSCISWCSNDEVYFVSEDLQIFVWNTTTRETIDVAKLPNDFLPTDLHWLVQNGHSSGGGKNSANLLVCSSDGRFIILNKSARVERNVSAHNGAISSGKWGPDGAGLLTAGEDGCIKIWSRSGMLRSTILQTNEPIYCAEWSPNSTSIVFSQGGYISIKPLSANSKIIRWHAHDGLVLCLSWSPQSNTIASGGEDLRFKIWDTQGANIFNSATEEHAITSIAFNPDNDLLIVGSHNMLKLCSNTGWTYNNCRFTEPIVGSFYKAAWSPDGTQIACGASSGNLITGHVLGKQKISKNLKATTTGRKTMQLADIVNGTKDELDFPERVINFSLGYGHLIVATSNQVHIYNEKYINTPIIIDGRNDVRIIEVSKKFFMILDANSIWIYSYNGRLHFNPRYPGSQAQIPFLTRRSISLGLDILAVRDHSDNTTLHIFDLVPAASRQYEPYSLRTKTQVMDVAACRAGLSEDQFVAFTDQNRELYITELRTLVNVDRAGAEGQIHKIGAQIIDLKWASETNILVGIHDAHYSIWYCAGEGAADPTIIALSTVTFDITEFGKNVSIESVEDAIIYFRSSGSLLPVNMNIYCEAMHRTLIEGQWQQALKICRLAQNTILWATLAAVATRKNQLEISEEAYCAALQIDKVSYLQYIKNLTPSSPEQQAENSLMLGRQTEAETILVHNQKYREAIDLCLRMHNWQRALDIAQKNQPNLVDMIVLNRSKYIAALGSEEWDERFKKLTIQDENSL